MGRFGEYRAGLVTGFVDLRLEQGLRAACAMLARVRAQMPRDGHVTADIMEVEQGLWWTADAARDATPAGWQSWPAYAHWRILDLMRSVNRWRERALSAEAATPWAISEDGQHLIGETRAQLARYLLDSKLSEAEALGCVRHHPAITEKN